MNQEEWFDVWLKDDPNRELECSNWCAESHKNAVEEFVSMELWMKGTTAVEVTHATRRARGCKLTYATVRKIGGVLVSVCVEGGSGPERVFACLTPAQLARI